MIFERKKMITFSFTSRKDSFRKKNGPIQVQRHHIIDVLQCTHITNDGVEILLISQKK